MSLKNLAQQFVAKHRALAPVDITYTASRSFTDRSNCARAMKVFAGTHLLSPDEFQIIKLDDRDYFYQRRQPEKPVASQPDAKATPAADDGGIPAAFKIDPAVRKAAWDNQPAKATPATTAKEPEMAARKTTATTKASARKPVKEGSRSRYDWAKAEELAAAGKIPPKLDFSAPTHARFRDALAEVVKAASAKDTKALAAIKINPVSSSPKALDRYRKLCVKALKASAAA